MTATAIQKEILVVEDAAAARSLIGKTLRDAGYLVREAQDGRDALAAIQQKAPDLVLSDVVMPVMDGYELVREVRRQFMHLREMPFILLSSRSDRNDIIKGLEIGADDYITKPMDPGILVQRVRAQLREAGRMLTKRNEELVKLYNAMSDQVTREEAAAQSGDVASETDAAEPLEIDESDFGQVFSRAFAARADKVRTDLRAQVDRLSQGIEVEQHQMQNSRGKPTPLRLPRFDPDTEAAVARLRGALGEDCALSAELDALLLTKLKERYLAGELPEQRLILSTVSFNTVMSQTGMALFERAYAATNGGLDEKLMLMVRDIPSTFSLPDSIMQTIGKMSRLRGLHLRNVKTSAGELERLRPVLVAVSYHVFAEQVARDQGAAIVFTGLVKACGAKLLVLDLPDDAREMAARMEVDLYCPARPQSSAAAARAKIAKA